MHDSRFEQANRIDRIARSLARGTSRRDMITLMGALAAGGLLPLARATGASANHKTRHCAKDGKRCHKHKECCGVCAADGYCRSCDGVVAWADRTLTRLVVAGRHANDAKSAIREIPLNEPINTELVQPVADASTVIGRFSTEVSTEVTPPPADDILRTLVEIFAVMADALEEYLDKVASEQYIETGDGAGIAVAAIDAFIAGIASTEASIASLRDTCAD